MFNGSRFEAAVEFRNLGSVFTEASFPSNHPAPSLTHAFFKGFYSNYEIEIYIQNYYWQILDSKNDFARF